MLKLENVYVCMFENVLSEKFKTTVTVNELKT